MGGVTLHQLNNLGAIAEPQALRAAYRDVLRAKTTHAVNTPITLGSRTLTPLHLSLAMAPDKMIMTLLARGANPNALDTCEIGQAEPSEGAVCTHQRCSRCIAMTALTAACLRGRVEAVRLMLNYGAQIAGPNATSPVGGLTPVLATTLGVTWSPEIATGTGNDVVSRPVFTVGDIRARVEIMRMLTTTTLEALDSPALPALDRLDSGAGVEEMAAGWLESLEDAIGNSSSPLALSRLGVLHSSLVDLAGTSFAAVDADLHLTPATPARSERRLELDRVVSDFNGRLGALHGLLEGKLERLGTRAGRPGGQPGPGQDDPDEAEGVEADGAQAEEFEAHAPPSVWATALGGDNATALPRSVQPGRAVDGAIDGAAAGAMAAPFAGKAAAVPIAEASAVWAGSLVLGVCAAAALVRRVAVRARARAHARHSRRGARTGATGSAAATTGGAHAAQHARQPPAASPDTATGSDRSLAATETVRRRCERGGSTGDAAPGEDQLDDDDSCCVICLDLERSHLLYPCGHQCVCIRCAPTIQGMPCPICREVVVGFCRVFN